MSVRKNKGVTLLEVIVCMLAISIMILVVLRFQRVNLQSRLEEEKLRIGIFQVDAVKNIVLCNLSYREIEEQFNNKTVFIHKENIESNSIRTNQILNIVDDSICNEYPFIRIITQEDLANQLMKIEIYYSFDEKREINSVFYKGNYEK